jgi:hypothetical protein
VSFHKYGDFFPGTGALGDVGTGRGSGYTVNVPLREGMDSVSYRNIYEPVMTKVGGAELAARAQEQAPAGPCSHAVAVRCARLQRSWGLPAGGASGAPAAWCPAGPSATGGWAGAGPGAAPPVTFTSAAAPPPLPHGQVMEVYQPSAVVMCCGADSLSGDRLGCFNLSLEGHSNCIEFIAKWVADARRQLHAGGLCV